MTDVIAPEDYMKMTDLEIKGTTEYDILHRQSKLLFPEVPEFVLDIAVLAYFKNGCKNTFDKQDEEAVKSLKKMYDDEPTVYHSVEIVDNPPIPEEEEDGNITCKFTE